MLVGCFFSSSTNVFSLFFFIEFFFAYISLCNIFPLQIVSTGFLSHRILIIRVFGNGPGDQGSISG